MGRLSSLRRISECWFVFLLCSGLLLRWVPGTWINPTFFQVGLYVMAVAWALGMVFMPWRIRGSFVLIPMGAAVIWPVVQLATGHTVSRWETEAAVLLWAGNFLAVFFGIQVIAESKRRKGLLQVLAVFAFAVILMSLLEHFSAPEKIFWTFDSGFTGIFGLFVSRDRYAAFAELTLSLFVWLAFEQRRYAGLWLGMAAATVASIVGSASRAGAVLAALETIALLVVVQRRAKWKTATSRGKLLTFGGLTAVFMVVVGVGALTDRLGDPDPYYGRREMLQSSIAMSRERPMFGFGVGNFQNSYPPYAKFDSDKVVNHAHNDWAEWAVDGGFPFLACMVAVAIWAVPRAIDSVWGIGILTVFAHSFVDFPLHDAAIELWGFALLGGLASAKAVKAG